MHSGLSGCSKRSLRWYNTSKTIKSRCAVRNSCIKQSILHLGEYLLYVLDKGVQSNLNLIYGPQFSGLSELASLVSGFFINMN